MSDQTELEGPTNVGDELHYRQRIGALERDLAFESILGKGAHGVAVLVRTADDAPSTRVVKLLRHEHLDDERIVRRFRRELATHARVSELLQVPRVVRCLDHRDAPEVASAHMVVSFFPEGTLETFLEGEHPVEQALAILLDSVEAVQALHGHGWIHRDVCPANVFVAREGKAFRGVLGDLGVGLFLTPNTIISDREIDAEQELRVGHAGYVDPFFCSTPEADVFAVGAILYRILAGTIPPRPDPDGLRVDRPVPEVAADTELLRQANRLLPQLTAAGDRLAATEVAEALRGLLATATPAPLRGARSSRRSSRRPARWLLAGGVAVASLLVGVGARAGSALVASGWPAGEAPPPVTTTGPEAEDVAAEPTALERDVGDLLRLAADVPPGSTPRTAALEEGVRRRLRQDPDRGDLRLALVRVLLARGREVEAAPLLRDLPPSSSHRPQLQQLRSVLAAGSQN